MNGEDVDAQEKKSEHTKGASGTIEGNRKRVETEEEKERRSEILFNRQRH